MTLRTGTDPASTRQRLADATRKVHLSLHRDPVLRRLVANNLTSDQYYRGLTVFQAFLAATEYDRARFGCWPRYSLAALVAALDKDLGCKNAGDMPLRCANRDEMLGALYVAHGAAFGRRLMRRRVGAALPRAPMNFLNAAPSDRLWQSLCTQLENSGGSDLGFEALCSGAFKAFALVGEVSRGIRAKA